MAGRYVEQFPHGRRFSPRAASSSAPLTWSRPARPQFKAAHNSFTGTLPASWGNLVNLHDLDLESNRLTGSIPTAWFPDQETCAANVGINGVHSISLNKNNLEGPLPDGMK